MPEKDVIKEGKKIYGTQITLAILTESFSEFSKSRHTEDKTFFPYQIFNCINYFDLYSKTVSQVRIILATSVNNIWVFRMLFLPGSLLLFLLLFLFVLFWWVESESESCSVMSNTLWPHGLYNPWNSLGQDAGVGSLSFLQPFPSPLPNSGELGVCENQYNCYICLWPLWRNLSTEELMLLNCGVGEDSWESLGLQGDPTSPS